MTGRVPENEVDALDRDRAHQVFATLPTWSAWIL